MSTISLSALSKDIILKEQYALAGFQFYLETFHPKSSKLLLESSNKDIILENFFSKIIDSFSSEKEKKKFKDFTTGLGILLSKFPSSEFKKQLQLLFKEIQSKNLSAEEIKNQLLNPKNSVNEAGSAFGWFSDWLENKGKVVRNLILGLLIAATSLKTNQNVINNTITQNTASIEAQATANTTSDNIEDTTGNYADALKNQGVKMTGTNDTPDEDTARADVGIKFDYGKGTQLDDKAKGTLNDLADEIAKIVKDTGKNVNIKVAGTVSNTTGDDEKATDTNQKLSDARGETASQYLQAELEKQLSDSELSKVKIEKAQTEPVENQTQEKVGGDEASGALINIETDVDQEAKLSWENWPEAARYKGGIPNENTPPDETPKDTEKTFDVSDAPPPSDTISKPIELTIPPVPATEFNKLNRNGQIATVLANINPKLNIGQYEEFGPIRSYTDRELENPNIKDAKAKELAKLIVTMRKNPDATLKKLSTATGIPLQRRAKAISTSPSKSTRAQLQSPTVRESKDLFQEAFIDDIFTKLGVSNEDINANKYKVISYLGSMYASDENTDLSVVNADELSDEDKKQLEASAKELGVEFSPQAGNNYVFLKGQKKNQVQQQADVTRVFKSVNKNTSLKNSLKRIGTKDELRDLIKAIISYTNEKFQQNASQIKTDLITIRNQYKAPAKTSAAASPIKEETQLNLPDVNAAIKLINSYSNLKAELDKINNRQELIQLLKGIIFYFDPALLGRESDVKAAFQGAASSITNKALMQKKAVNEIERMKELAGLIK